MKKLVALFVLVSGLSGATVSFAQETEGANPNGPEFKFEEETFDFGEATEGDKLEHVFGFTNIGKEPLIITNARASCGCTVPDWPKEPILPGQKGSVKVVFNTRGKPGVQKKTITISSNAKTPTKLIYIKALVKRAEEEGIPEKQSDGPVENK